MTPRLTSASRGCGLPCRSGRASPGPRPRLGGQRRPPCPRKRTTTRRGSGARPLRSSSSPFTNPAVNYAINKAAEVVEGVSKKRKPRYDGTFALVLANLVVFAVGRLGYNIQPLLLSHLRPQWYQFLTCIFSHMTWQHLSSNLFFLYIFGKLVEEEEGGLGVVMTYVVCGVGGAAASLLLGPKHALSLGASGAVFGLFVVSVLVKLSLNPRKLIESAILGQFVYQQVANEVRMQAGRHGAKQVMAGGSQISHVAHLAGALAGVLLILVISRLPAAQGK